MTTEDGSNEMFDNLLTTESKYEDLHTTLRHSYSNAQAGNVKHSDTKIIRISAMKFKDRKKEVHQVFQYRIAEPYTKETIMRFLKQKTLVKI